MHQSPPPQPISLLGNLPRQEIIRLDPALLRSHAAFRARGFRSRETWSGSFSIAAWLRFPDGLSHMVQLMLCFRDQERRRTFIIDRCFPNRQTLILMNGIVDLTVTGEVKDLSLCLAGPDDDVAWMLDEYNLEANRAAPLEQRRAL